MFDSEVMVSDILARSLTHLLCIIYCILLDCISDILYRIPESHLGIPLVISYPSDSIILRNS